MRNENGYAQKSRGIWFQFCAYLGTCAKTEIWDSWEPSTAHANTCMRQQFSPELNVRISQSAADLVKNLRRFLGGHERVSELSIRSFRYMHLADNEDFAAILRENQAVQLAGSAPDGGSH